MSIYGYARVSTKTQDIRRQLKNIIEKYPNAIIYQEAHSGAKLEGRDVLDQLLRKVKTDDTIVFDSASRMSRCADEAMELYEKLFRNGVHLVFLNEPHINSDVFQKSLNKQISINAQTGNRATDAFLKSIIEALNKFTLDLASEQIRKVFEQAQQELLDNHSRVQRGLQVRIDRNEELKEADPLHYKEHKDYRQIGHSSEDSIKLTTKKSLTVKPQILKKSLDFYGKFNDTELCAILKISRNTLKKYKRELRELLDEQNDEQNG